MSKKLNRNIQDNKYPRQNLQFNRPFWFSTLNYYILTTAITIACFFIIWGVLLEIEEGTPWITAGIVASLVLVSSVVLRELVLRKNYQKALLAQKRLDYNLKSVYKEGNNNRKTDRLTLERNTEILREIEKKSKAVQSFAKLSAPHLEVFEICEAYLQKSNRELAFIMKGSPRFAALTRGQERVKELRRFHLLSWASLESQFFIQNSKVQASINEKLESASRALDVLDSAIQVYPTEPTLLDSVEAIKDYIVSIRISYWIEQAERSAFKEHYKRAINHYRDALFFLARENKRTPERELMAEKINFEIEKLRKKTNKRISS